MTVAPETGLLQQLSTSIAGIVAGASPSVVSVHSHRAQSSGFVWKPGLIITADEGLAEEGEVAVTLAGGTRVVASVAGRDRTTDLALLRAETGHMPAAALHSPPLDVGTLAVAVGSQDGAPLAALGLVALSGPAWRSMRGGEIDGRIELDLSLCPQAEGGLALGADGLPFGMAVFGPRRRVLVIPAATIARVAAQIEASGKVARGYLGLGLQPVRLDQHGGEGAMVMSVDADGPGAAAGLQQGDIVTAWNEQPIVSVGALLRGLGPSSIGTTVALSLRRGGAVRTVDIVIGERP